MSTPEITGGSSACPPARDLFGLSSARPTGGGPRLLFPLVEFYRAEGRAPPAAAEIPAGEVPQPYRQLLVHNRDMTPTLEAYHGERIHLRVLRRRLVGASLWREVVLVLNGSGVAVEFGAIVIHCDRFPAAAQEGILADHRPLGTILADHAIEHRSCPQAFLRLRPDALIREALSVKPEQTESPLYGRRNAILAMDQTMLAEILEILPVRCP